VRAVHDLHIWAMSTTETALTAHLVRAEAGLADAFLQQTARELGTALASVTAAANITPAPAAMTAILAMQSFRVQSQTDIAWLSAPGSGTAGLRPIAPFSSAPRGPANRNRQRDWHRHFVRHLLTQSSANG
jgi:hypothetical protein